MSGPAAIQGVYADYKRIKGRKVIQLIVEVPMEQAPMVHSAFGEPNPDGSTWVAVALLNPEAKPKPIEKTDHKLSQQAAMCCQDQRFYTFLRFKHSGIYFNIIEPRRHNTTEEICRNVVLHLCNVSSRAEFDTDQDAAKRWRDLHAEFKAWLLTA